MLASALFALALVQDSKQSLHFVPKPKESWAYKAAIQVNDGSEMKGKARFTFTVDEVTADGSWTNTLAMDDVEMEVNGEVDVSGGNSMTIPRDAYGVAKDWNSYDARDAVGFDAVELLLGYTPPAPVAKGESWKGRVPGASELEPLKFTYEGQEKVEGKTFHKVSAAGNAPSAGDVTGTLWLSTDRNKVVRFVIGSKKEADGKQKFSLKFDPAE